MSARAQEPAAPAGASSPAASTSVSASTAAPPEASASTSPTVSLALERVGGISLSTISQSDADTSAKIVAFGVGSVNPNPYTAPRLGVDYVLPMNLTLGAALGFGRFSLTENNNGKSDDVGSLFIYTLTPRIGYRLALAPMFDLTPRVGITFAGGKLSSGDDKTSEGVFAVALGGEVVGALRATSSFNLLAGLGIDQTIAATATSTTTSTTVTGGSGGTTTTTSTSSKSEDIKGALFSLQLWLGIGGYL